jgi:hypothetical protein
MIVSLVNSEQGPEHCLVPWVKRRWVPRLLASKSTLFGIRYESHGDVRFSEFLLENHESSRLSIASASPKAGKTSNDAPRMRLTAPNPRFADGAGQPHSI